MTLSESTGTGEPDTNDAASDITAAGGGARSGPAASSEPEYGFPAGLWRALDRHRPPGLARLSAFRSPLRGPWLTSVFGSILLVALPFVIVTGLLDWIAYSPRLGQAMPANVGWLHLPLFDWPTSPTWLFRFTEGLHVVLGLVIIPVVLAKLWSVLPKLFTWPPARTPAQVLERISLLMLVGGIQFEIATGVLNIQYDYIFGFSFYTAHYYGACVFLAGFVVHVGIKLPRMIHSLRSRSLCAEFRTSRADTRPEPADVDGLVAAHPGPATISRRGAGARRRRVPAGRGPERRAGHRRVHASICGAASARAQLRRRAERLPGQPQCGRGGPHLQRHRRRLATDPCVGARARSSWTAPRGSRCRSTRVRLPIACVEGWSTTQTWTGVRLRDLASLTGVPAPTTAFVRSLEKKGSFNAAALQHNQLSNADSLLALRVNGADLSLDHGYPARIIVPAMPGVHNTKWVRTIDFRDH